METAKRRRPPAPATMSAYLLGKSERRFGYPRRIAYDPKTAALLSRFPRATGKTYGPEVMDLNGRMGGKVP